MTNRTPPSGAWTVRSGWQGRHGFTLVELLLVMLILAILAAVALPNLKTAIMKARAAEAVGDLRVVRQAVYDYLADKNEWPPDAGVGAVPLGMAEYLPDGWSMTKETYALNYEPQTVGPIRFIAVAVQVDDPELGNYVLDMLGPNAWLNGTDRFTWAFEWLD